MLVRQFEVALSEEFEDKMRNNLIFMQDEH